MMAATRLFHIIMFLAYIRINVTQFLEKHREYEILLERSEMPWYNKNIIEEGNIITFKYNRSVASINGTVTYKVEVKSMTTKATGYRYFVNEYKKQAIQFDLDLCKVLLFGSFGSQIAKTNGNLTNCPLKKGKYLVYNVNLLSNFFPPNIPEGRWKLLFQTYINEIHGYDINFYMTVEYKLSKKQIKS